MNHLLNLNIDKEELKENYHFDFFNDKLESLNERKKELEGNLASNQEKYLEKIIEQLENYENKIKFILSNNGQIFKDDDIRDKIGKTTFYKGIKELKDVNFLAPTLQEGKFWINADYVFRGDRLTLVNEYIIADNEELINKTPVITN